MITEPQPTNSYIQEYTKDDIELQRQLLELLEIQENTIQYNKLSTLFPEKGPFARNFYQKHVNFMNAGATYRQRAMFGANRSGKTTTAAFEVACHMTGLYPDWWEGRKFKNSGDWWAIGQSNQQVKEVMQKELLGPLTDIGSGMIPKHLIVGQPVLKPGTGGTIESFRVQHVSGSVAELIFKTCDQDDSAYMGSKKQGAWFDEEPTRISLYSEVVTRTADKFAPGIIICTFTPLKSLSDVVLSFLLDGKFPPNGANTFKENPYKYIEKIMWDDMPPHLTEEDKQELIATYSSHEISARTRGEPGLGQGAIYPYSEEFISVAPFQIPDYWPICYGLDVGWNHTAAVWITQDPESKIKYIISEHYLSGEAAKADGGNSPIPVHASAIRQRGQWIMGAIDSAVTGTEYDGNKLIDLYTENGLNLILANKRGIETDLAMINQLFATGMLKVFSHLQYFFTEYRLYRRNDKLEIVKKRDHAMDAMRYGLKHFDEIADVCPSYNEEMYKKADYLSRDSITGY